MIGDPIRPVDDAASGQQQNGTDVAIRWLTKRHLADIISIDEKAGSRHSWNEHYFVITLRNRNVAGIVAQRHQTVIGFVIYELRKNTLRLLRIGVDPANRHTGIGRKMVETLIERLPVQRNKIEVIVDEVNLGAQKFFQKCGFAAKRMRKDCFDDIDGDAYEMHLVVKSPSNWQQRIAEHDPGDQNRNPH